MILVVCLAHSLSMSANSSKHGMSVPPPSVLLVGAGQLGSRYLQGLAAIQDDLTITVMDPSEDSLAFARHRLEQVSMTTTRQITFTTSLQDVPNELDLALVATPAHCRARVVSDLSSSRQIKAWILEKLLAQSCRQLNQIQHALLTNSQVWVNTPRRLMSWHQLFRSHMLRDDHDSLQVRVTGGSWGLACNSIHFIDLVSWWTQASVNSVNGNRLGEWVESKRPGFYEVFGTLIVTYSDGSELELFCKSVPEPLQITVETEQGKWLIDESAGCITGPANKRFEGQLSFQSELTAPLVKQILQEDHCELPTLPESIVQHRPLLSALHQHWIQCQGCQDSTVPIT